MQRRGRRGGGKRGREKGNKITLIPDIKLLKVTKEAEAEAEAEKPMGRRRDGEGGMEGQSLSEQYLNFIIKPADRGRPVTSRFTF